jgi:hypothetical protein
MVAPKTAELIAAAEGVYLDEYISERNDKGSTLPGMVQDRRGTFSCSDGDTLFFLRYR